MAHPRMLPTIPTRKSGNARIPKNAAWASACETAPGNGIPRKETNSSAARIPVKVAKAVAFTVSSTSARAKPEPNATTKMNHPIGMSGRGPKL